MAVPKIIQDIRSIKTSINTLIYQIKNLTEDNLVGKYYNAIASMTTNSDMVTSSVNPLPTTWTPVGGSNSKFSNGNYTIEASAEPIGMSYTIAKAFDGDPVTAFICAPTSTNLDIIITLPEPITVTKVKYRVEANNITNCIVFGSNDKSTWYTLHTNTAGSENIITEKVLSSSANYKYYRLTVIRNSTQNISVYEFQISSYRIGTYTNKLTVDGIPKPLDINQRVLIRTPVYQTVGLTSVLFNDVTVDAILLPNRYYELVYDGTKYLSKEVV